MSADISKCEDVESLGYLLMDEIERLHQDHYNVGTTQYDFSGGIVERADGSVSGNKLVPALQWHESSGNSSIEFCLPDRSRCYDFDELKSKIRKCGGIEAFLRTEWLEAIWAVHAEPLDYWPPHYEL